TVSATLVNIGFSDFNAVLIPFMELAKASYVCVSTDFCIPSHVFFRELKEVIASLFFLFTLAVPSIISLNVGMATAPNATIAPPAIPNDASKANKLEPITPIIGPSVPINPAKLAMIGTAEGLAMSNPPPIIFDRTVPNDLIVFANLSIFLWNASTRFIVWSDMIVTVDLVFFGILLMVFLTSAILRLNSLILAPTMAFNRSFK